MEKRTGHFKRIWTLAYGVGVLAFSIYALLDTFVISSVYTVVDDNEAIVSETAKSDSVMSDTAARDSEDARISDNEYESENVKISIDTYREYDTDIYVADVQLNDASSLRTAFADNAYGKRVEAHVSEISSDVNAILAINGDNYGSRESGYVIRQGVIYRDTAVSGQEDLVIYDDGSFNIISEDDVSAQELMDDGAVNVFSFGPGLVQNGEISVSEGEEVGRAMASNPRTAIGIVGEGHYVFVVSDGRTSESAGLSLAELAEFMSEELNVETAYNLDGGGSSTMVFNGNIINNPTGGGHGSSGGERAVSDILYIGLSQA